MNRTQEILDLLQEECAEVIQNISKVRRFGLDNEYLNGTGTQREALVKEIADVSLLLGLLESQGLFTRDELKGHMDRKVEKLRRWTTVYND